ncbi:hypothetical protein PACTADRAFT_4063 [Pachysolen tannophilus NRRL Y-2460]|uniref:Uncharacterized protein n=1 Tax=Pachysolen tannophilus NRRL Y-2460 TaxID=669874 RepID=A0A1E4TQZ4_PACTA|nr:hypothetical protein PACTADRAFT_4063 [Pachysolen tannophilus NRRL Y-2460]
MSASEKQHSYFCKECNKEIRIKSVKDHKYNVHNKRNQLKKLNSKLQTYRDIVDKLDKERRKLEEIIDAESGFSSKKGNYVEKIDNDNEPDLKADDRYNELKDGQTRKDDEDKDQDKQQTNFEISPSSITTLTKPLYSLTSHQQIKNLNKDSDNKKKETNNQRSKELVKPQTSSVRTTNYEHMIQNKEIDENAETLINKNSVVPISSLTAIVEKNESNRYVDSNTSDEILKKEDIVVGRSKRKRPVR